MDRVWGVIWVVIPLIVAAVIAWRQVRAWDWQRSQPDLSQEDRRYFRRQVVRRLALCLLLVLAAAMVGGLFGMGILDELDRLMAAGDDARAQGRKLTPEEHDFMMFSIRYVIGLTLVVLVIFVVVFMELMAIRRYGMRHRKRIRDDRQAMLRRQLPELYRERREKRERGDGPEQSLN